MNRLREAREAVERAERDLDDLVESAAKPYRLWSDELIRGWDDEVAYLNARHYRCTDATERAVLAAKIEILKECIEDAKLLKPRPFVWLTPQPITPEKPKRTRRSA